MRYRNRSRNTPRRLGGLIFLAIVLFAVFGRGFGIGFLPLVMIGLALATLVSSFGTSNPRGVYGGIQGFVWFMGLAFCFIINSFWPWILLPIVISALLGILARPIMAALLGMGIFGAANTINQQPMYTPPMQSYQPPVQPYQPPVQPYQSYGEGYQPPVEQPPTYQEGSAQYPYPTTPSQAYEQPQAQYPQQELPPQR